MFAENRKPRSLSAALAVVVASLFVVRPAYAEPAATDHAPTANKASGHAQAAEKTDAQSAASVWNRLVAGNARFVADQERPREFTNTRRKLAQGQHPQAIVLTCADSRLSPELIFDANLGELFVVRTAGNIADPIVLGSIEYAVEHLHVNTIVVLGHEKCGAVAAAASGEAMPTANLAAVVKKIEPALDAVRSQTTGDEFVRRGIEANVRAVTKDLLTNSPILREKADESHLTVFPAIYRLESGKVELLK